MPQHFIRQLFCKVISKIDIVIATSARFRNKNIKHINLEDLKKINFKKKIGFLSTPFDLESIDLLNNIKLECFKIPSGEITNLPYLRKIGKLKKKIIYDFFSIRPDRRCRGIACCQVCFFAFFYLVGVRSL